MTAEPATESGTVIGGGAAAFVASVVTPAFTTYTLYDVAVATGVPILSVRASAVKAGLAATERPAGAAGIIIVAIADTSGPFFAWTVIV